VNRVIHFTATDLAGTVNKWWWNFGTGIYEAPSVITKVFTGDGYKPFTIIGMTIHGCKDTIIRPFTTYSNYAYAGHDTVAAMQEPVQLFASGGIQYLWTPASGLNNPAINYPVATWDKDQLYLVKAISREGCDSYSRVFIKRYKGPELYVPSAFTPNGDNLNDVLKVFPVGIRKFGYFIIYNRMGEKVFYTTDYSKGWDGSYKGRALETGSYIFIATATDYKGNEMVNKGTVIMLR
jgi:gliding motility-associated-like protein